MPMFRKKQIVIEAVQLTWETWNLLVEWCNADYAKSLEGVFVINTLEGPMTAQVGDWIIRGVKGEFYPCKPDIFAACYEAAQ